MGCKDCQIRQDGTTSAFYRWDVANIEIRGCRKHIGEVMAALSEHDALKAENKKLREALKETVHRLRWVNVDYDETPLVNRSIEQGDAALKQPPEKGGG